LKNMVQEQITKDEKTEDQDVAILIKAKDQDLVDVDEVQRDEEMKAMFQELVRVTEEIKVIEDDIEKENAKVTVLIDKRWGDALMTMGRNRDELQHELGMLSEGREWQHPDGLGEVVVKSKRRAAGKVDPGAVTYMEENPAEFGPPSNFFLEVPASYKLRSLSEIDKAVNALGLDDKGRAALFNLLRVKGGEQYTEVIIHEQAAAVDQALQEDEEKFTPGLVDQAGLTPAGQDIEFEDNEELRKWMGLPLVERVALAHEGDPCKHCGEPMDGVAVGPCPVQVKKKDEVETVLTPGGDRIPANAEDDEDQDDEEFDEGAAADQRYKEEVEERGPDKEAGK